MSTKKEKFLNVVRGLGDVAQEAIQSYIDEEINQAVSREKNAGMHNAVDALIEIGVTDEERIIKFLQKYGDMRESEAKAASKEIITVEIPSKRLVGHLVKQGYTDQEVANFMKSNMARIKLRHDPR